MKPYAKKRGIKISGLKSDLVSRLENSDDIVQ
ncbi:MAG: SAP domain-containing protein [Candidatus Poseidoniaceae archaeon]